MGSGILEDVHTVVVPAEGHGQATEMLGQLVDPATPTQDQILDHAIQEILIGQDKVEEEFPLFRFLQQGEVYLMLQVLGQLWVPWASLKGPEDVHNPGLVVQNGAGKVGVWTQGAGCGNVGA